MKVFKTKSAEIAMHMGVDVTVEAEYGGTMIEGELMTLAHHVVKGDCPCLNKKAAPVGYQTHLSILISHIDLDTVGGIASVINHPIMVGNDSFWELAALVDVTGPHNPSVRVHPNYPQLLAYWAWSQDNREARYEGLLDCTGEVMNHMGIIADILGEMRGGGTGSLHQAGKAFADAEEELNRSSYVGTNGFGIVRKSDKFVNHLYTAPDSKRPVDRVIGYNTKTGSFTLSYRDDEARGNESACKIMQQAFGPLAGGHAGIAGSPRGVDIVFDDGLLEIVTAIRAAQ